MKTLFKLETLAVAASFLAVVGTASAQIATTTYGGDTFYLFSAPYQSWAADESAANADGGYLAIRENLR